MVFKIENYATLRSAIEEFCDFLSLSSVPQNSIFDSKLVLYELLGNVVKHTGGNASLQGSVKNGFVEVKILSSAPFQMPKHNPCADVHAEHGRGLFLVDSVCYERLETEDGGILVRIKIQ